MAKARKGLGRGLSALLADAAGDEADEAPRPDAPQRTAPIEFIEPNPDQPRKSFDPEAIEELAASIRRQGLLQPILVRPIPASEGPQRYQIVAGERRWRAAQKAGLHDAPIIVRDLDDGQAAEIALVENVQRRDLNPLEEAAGFERLASEYGRSQEEIAAAVGKSRSHVANLMRLLKLPSAVQEMVGAGDLSMGHARALLGAGDPKAVADAVVSKGLSVRQTEALIRSETATPRPKDKLYDPRAYDAKKEMEREAWRASQKDADTKALQADLSAALGLVVDVDHGQTGGTVTIRYRTLDQLDEVCRRLLDSAV